MKIHKLSFALLAIGLGLSTFLIVAPSKSEASGTTLYWCSSASSDFNTASNWNTNSSCTGGTQEVPVNGDSLDFNASNLAQVVNVNNDISGLSLGSLTFTGTNANNDNYYLTGDDINLSGGIVSSSTPDIGFGITLTANQAFTGNGGILFATGGSPNIDLGSYTITFGSGSDSFSLDNQDASFTGNNATMIISNGATVTQNTTAYNLIADIIVNSGGVLNSVPDGAGYGTTFTVSDGGNLCLSGFDGAGFYAPITLGGPNTLTASTDCEKDDNLSTYNADASADLFGNIVLTGNTTVDTDGTITISAPLSGNYTITPDTNYVGDLVVDSSDNTSNTPNGTYSPPPSSTATTASDPSSTNSSAKNVKTPDTGYGTPVNHSSLLSILEVLSLTATGGGILTILYRKLYPPIKVV